MSAAEQVRVMIQVIEVDHAQLTEWRLDSDLTDEAIHRKAIELAVEEKAQLIDTSLVTFNPEAKGSVMSFAEWIYPTEYDPA